METIILDIETGDADEASLFREQLLVKPNANTRLEKTKMKQIKEKQEKLAENAALLDSSPILCIGTKSHIGLRIFASSCDIPLQEIPDLSIVRCATEKMALLAFSDFLSSGEVCFVGHNIEKRKDIDGFDLPHLRFRYAFHGIPLPKCIDPYHTQSIDTMFLAWKSSHAKTPFISLDEIALRLGIIDRLFPVDGKDIPKLWDQGEIQTVTLKNVYDLLLTEQVYRRLSAW